MSAFRRHENCDTYRAKDFASSSPLLLQQQKQQGRCLSSVITDTSRTCMHSFCSLSASVAGSSISRISSLIINRAILLRNFENTSVREQALLI